MNTWICAWFGAFLGLSALAKGGTEYEFEAIPLQPLDRLGAGTPPFQAQNFTPGDPSDPFADAKGTYHGLIVSPGSIVPEQSGSFRINVNSHLDYSGSMVTGDYSTPLQGYFDSQGESGVQIYKKEWDDCHCYYALRHIWTVRFQLIPGTDEVEGSVYHVRLGWLSDLFGFRGRRSVDGHAPEAGRYTLRFPGSTDPATAPGGDGYGTFTVSSSGQLNLSGKLGDGSAFSRSVLISTNGWWPLHVPFHDGRGTLIGWLQFSFLPESDVAGDLFWSKPFRDGAQYYPNGFTGTINATGGRYTKPSSTETALGWTNGVASLSGGNVLVPASNQVTLKHGGKLTDNGGDISKLTFSLTTGNGIFKGKFLHPTTGKSTSYVGALHQVTGLGTGYFLGPDQGGLFRLEPIP